MRGRSWLVEQKLLSAQISLPALVFAGFVDEEMLFTMRVSQERCV